MQQIVFFIQKFKYFLFFLCLETLAIFLIIQNNSFYKSNFINSSNFIVGSYYEKTNQYLNYFYLKEQNEQLISENTKLRNNVQILKSQLDTIAHYSKIDSTFFHQKFHYINGKIINNNYHTSYNFITINRGENHHVAAEMAVINDHGVIGIIDDVSNHYARVQSILNKNSKINARLKKSFHFGTLIWDGKDQNTVQLIDFPRQANIQIGDTIITGGKSTIFPEGIFIGSVVRVDQTNSTSKTVDIRLFNDMTSLADIYVVQYLDKFEIQTLERQLNE